MKICIVTGNRSEYGLLKLLIRKFLLAPKIEPYIIVTGDHLDPEINSLSEIISDSIPVHCKINLKPKKDEPSSILIAMGQGMKDFSPVIDAISPQAILLLGDRYESLVVAICSLMLKIPLLHISGGEITEGSIDDTIRHAITKLADYHFVAIDQFKKRVLQMGEDPSRVFVVGGMGVDAISNIKLLTHEQTISRLGIENQMPLILCTYHPLTAFTSGLEECQIMLKALSQVKDCNIVITYPNPDYQSKSIIQLIQEFASNNSNCFLFPSLGQLLYLSALNISKLVIGNSSSGITEAPYFGCVTINIGKRQEGRPRCSSIYDLDPDCNKILSTIQSLLEDDKDRTLNLNNIYGTSGASQKIFEFLEQNLGQISKKKSFFDHPYI